MPAHRNASRTRRLGLSLAWLLALTACQPTANEYVAPPPPPVTVARPAQRSVTDYLEYTGTTRASETVEIRARVSGFLESMHFEPGTPVRQGDLLFVIDPKPYEARAQIARSDIANNKALLAKAESDYQRKAVAIKKGAVTEADLVAAQADRDAAVASVSAAEAALTQAELDLGYTQVIAHISGRVGRNLVDAGNLVGQSEPTLLTTVTRYDPVYVYFNMNERDLLRMIEIHRARIADGESPGNGGLRASKIPLFLGLANEDGHPHRGLMDFAESSVDPSTGTISLRAVFDNPLRPPVLYPGLFARLRLPVAERREALLVRDRAVGADPSGRYVLVVGADNVVEQRPVTLGQLHDGMRVVLGGLEAGDRVVVNGLQRARPGTEVDPTEVEMAGDDETAAATAGGNG
jgi:RND family efflux transporter MFP subunit